MTEHARCDCSLCNDERATKELRHDVAQALKKAMAGGEEPSGVPFLHFRCDVCKTEHRLRGNRLEGVRRLICSVCGAAWVRR